MSTTESWRNPRPAPTLDEVRHRMPPSSVIPPWVRAWAPALLWAGVIFFASTDTFSSDNTSGIIERIVHWVVPFLSPAALDLAHHFIRKAAHFTEYFVFFVLLYRAVRGMRQGWRWSWAVGAWLIAASYSALDEFHQSFVPSRAASPWDSLLDSAAALFALVALFLLYRIRPRSHSS